MGFGTIIKLKSFLSERNLVLLDVILSGLVEPRAKAFQPFWSWFLVQRGDALDDVTYAARSLEQLRGILREYLSESKR